MRVSRTFSDEFIHEFIAHRNDLELDSFVLICAVIVIRNVISDKVPLYLNDTTEQEFLRVDEHGLRMEAVFLDLHGLVVVFLFEGEGEGFWLFLLGDESKFWINE